LDCKGRTEGFGEKHKRLGYRESHTNEFYELGVRKRLIWRKSDRMRFKRCGEVRDEGFEESACAIHAGKQCECVGGPFGWHRDYRYRNTARLST